MCDPEDLCGCSHLAPSNCMCSHDDISESNQYNDEFYCCICGYSTPDMFCEEEGCCCLFHEECLDDK